MSSASQPPNLNPFTNPSDPGVLAQKIARLRAECDASSVPRVRAILLHEIGALEEMLGDEASAARDQLGAVNTEPEFREPLERLISIIERRQSYKNLGKLLERLSRVADTPEERSRALALRAAYFVDHENEPQAAREALELALEHSPEDSALWLMLEVLAGRLDDGALRARALSARARLTQHPTWRALLLIDLADAELGQGHVDAALEALDSAIEHASTASFLGLLALEELGQKKDRLELTARALEAQAKLILQAIADPREGDEHGVPYYRRTAAHAADTFMRAADAQRRRGDLAAATALLDQALSRLPDEPALLHARMSAAEGSGDTRTAAQLAQQEIARGAKGPLAATLYLRIAEAAASEGDGPGALAAVTRALEQDPGCIPARVLQLDLLSGGADPQQLAAALEAAAEQLETDEARARFYLSSADIWARLCNDAQGAKAALSQASMYGAAPGSVARLARLLASLTDDPIWYEEATRRLLAAGAAEGEEAGLWFELARARLLRGEAGGAELALQGLSEARGGAWLGHALRAYAHRFVKAQPEPAGTPSRRPSTGPPPNPTAALKQLALTDTSPEQGHALRTVVALRALLDGTAEGALEELLELHGIDPSDALTSTALAALLRERGETERAGHVLASAARSTDDASLAAALELEAGILSWQSGTRNSGVEAFKLASERSEALAGELLGWALRALDPNVIESRRRALESASAHENPTALALESFALEVGRDGVATHAAAALETIRKAGGDFEMAGHLARALWSNPQADDLEERLSALDRLASQGSDASALARAAAYQLRLAQAAGGAPDERELEASAFAWAEADPSAAAALEWLSHALQTGNVESEVAARRALAERLDPVAREPLEASAALIGLLGGQSVAGWSSSSPYAKLTNLELAQPGSDPRRRSGALLDAASTFGDESSALLRALAGWNQLAALDAEAAFASFREVVDRYPEEVIGWEGLRAAAELSGDRAAFAEACAALGDAVSDAARGAELWEQAAFVLLDELGDEARGEYALSRAVARDVRRFGSFDRLFRSVRAKRNGPQLLELIARRLEVAEDPEEIAKLFWERARVLREAGDREGALAALENVTFLEPDHVGALALSGEICIKNGQFEQAAENLGRLAQLEAAPAKQRLMSGVAAVDIYENKLNDPHKSLEILMGLYRSGLSTLPVRERLARAAAKTGAWAEATQVLENLMHERETRQGRIEAARLCMAIYRDRLDDLASAEDAAERILSEAPEDGEALDLIMVGAPHTSATRNILERGREDLVSRLMKNPLDPERVDRLARIAKSLENAPLRQAALGVLVALGEGSAEIDAELAVLDKRVAHIPQIAIDERALPELCDEEDRGPLGLLMRELAQTFADALGPSVASLGVSKKDRVDPRAGLPLRNEVAAWAGALGLGDFELYIGGREPHGVFGIATEIPSIVLGPVVSAPLSAPHRQAVARELFALRRGTTILRYRDTTNVSALIVAACRIAGFNLPSPEYAMLGDFQRSLGKEMSRKVRRVLPELAAQVVSANADPAAWARAAISSLDRMATVAAGDVSWVLSGGTVESRGQIGNSREAHARAVRLLSFALSPIYLSLREKLGMGVR